MLVPTMKITLKPRLQGHGLEKFDQNCAGHQANQGLGLAVIEVAGKRYPSNT
jgi:hypothetical protein